MELEFDKEMDALLRRARGETAAAVGDHIDADAISAFAENALPDAMRSVYMSHLADCGKCRKLLSFNISTMETAATSAAVQEAAVVATATESFWSRLFRAPNLAMAMGALVLAFGGVLGYIAIQNQSSPNATVASSNKAESRADGTATQPFEAPSTAAPSANIPQVAASPDASTNNTTVPNGSVVAKPTVPATVPSDSGTTTDTIVGGVPAPEARPVPPAATRNQPITSGTGSPEREVSKDEDKSLAGAKADDYTRDGTPRSPKKVNEGPTRGNLSIQQQIESNTANVYEMPSRKRTAGGRTFEDRDGVWTDTAYRGGSVTVYKRGSEPYKKLDSSIRSIADQLGGTVIIVAGSRAYKIQ